MKITELITENISEALTIEDVYAGEFKNHDLQGYELLITYDFKHKKKKELNYNDDGSISREYNHSINLKKFNIDYFKKSKLDIRLSNSQLDTIKEHLLETIYDLMIKYEEQINE